MHRDDAALAHVGIGVGSALLGQDTPLTPAVKVVWRSPAPPRRRRVLAQEISDGLRLHKPGSFHPSAR
ncbi:hypothetical protein [Streptomyces sp. HC307]|uniref:hypothetical protein n=1 Tax=Streptomyces flavusporus TaxID=3385496 RepID=UPI003916D428